MRARTWIAAALLVLVAACGGKTGEGEGSGGIGGSSGGAGGSGGSSAGSAGSGGAAIPELIGVVCDQLDTPPCAFPDCEDELYESWAEAFEDGCEKQFLAALQCLAKQPLTCAGHDVQIPSACVAIVDSLESCMIPSASCGGSIGNGTCSIHCDGWGATCSEHMGALSCQCTLGPSTGKAFTLPGSCSPAGLEQAESWCG
jgi:hypothetical protein